MADSLTSTAAAAPSSTSTVAEPTPTAAPHEQAPGLLSSLPMMIAIIAVFYFLLIRPQQKEAKQHAQLVAGLKKGDRVVTGSGLHGRIYEVGEKEVQLEIADRVRVTVDKVSIKRKLGAPDRAAAKKGA